MDSSGYTANDMEYNLLTKNPNATQPPPQSQPQRAESDTSSIQSLGHYIGNSSSGGGQQYQDDRSVQSERSSYAASYRGSVQSEQNDIDIQAEYLEKKRILTKLRRLRMRGEQIDNNLSMETPLEELEFELELIRKEKKQEQALDIGKSLITMFAVGVEMVNKRYDPLDLYLDGWSTSVREDIDSYDETLEELYDKYYEHIDASPEVKLIGGLLFSAIAYNISHKMTSQGNTTLLSKIAKDHVSQQMDTVVSGPSGGLADEILQKDLRELKQQSQSRVVQFTD
jgi:hypothetical protein